MNVLLIQSFQRYEIDSSSNIIALDVQAFRDEYRRF